MENAFQLAPETFETLCAHSELSGVPAQELLESVVQDYLTRERQSRLDAATTDALTRYASVIERLKNE